MSHTTQPFGVTPDGTFFDRARSLRRLTDNKVEAELLEHILFWSEKGGYRDGTGTRWLIRTADEFAAHVDWSISTIYKALRRLVAKGLIEVRHSYHRYRQGKFHCTYVRPLVRLIRGQIVAPVAHRDAHMDANSEVTSGVSSKCPPGSLPIYSSSQHTASTALAAPAAEEETRNPQEHQEPQEEDRELGQQSSLPVRLDPEISTYPQAHRDDAEEEAPQPKKTLADLFAAQKAKPLARPSTAKPLTAEGVHQEIRHHHKEAWPEEVPPTLNGIRRKWLKTFLERVRAVNCTDAEVLALVARVVGNWDGFKLWLKDRQGFAFKEVRPTHQAFMVAAVEMVNFHRMTNESTMSTDDDALPEGTTSLADLMKGETGGSL